MHNPVSTLVYSSTMQNIESVAVDGNLVLENGVLTTVPDEQAMLRKAQQTAENLCRRGGITNRGTGHKWRSIAF
jgi:5-methylthioadenosine/S-adenosylhomocysteine deaminase